VYRRAFALLAALIIGALSTGVGARQTQTVAVALPREEGRERNLRAYTELMRRDIRTQKVALITELMQFTEQQDTAFWPIYREYETELSRVYDIKLQLIESYAERYATLTDTQADELVAKWFEAESRRGTLRQKYYAALKKAITPLVAARALQIEHQLDLIVDLQTAAELPVIPTK
jgi:hypothetical protein